jgi:hypothetical protein
MLKPVSPSLTAFSSCGKTHMTLGMKQDRGSGGRKIRDAKETGNPELVKRVRDDVEAECRRLCPNYTRLSAIFNEGEGGIAQLRGDTTQDESPTLNSLIAQVNGRTHRPIEDSEEEAEEAEGMKVAPSLSIRRVVRAGLCVAGTEEDEDVLFATSTTIEGGGDTRRSGQDLGEVECVCSG